SRSFPCGSQYQSATLAIPSQAKLTKRTKVFSLRLRVLKATVTSRFDEPSIVFCNAGLNKVALDSLDARMRTLFIQFHEAAVAYNIACDDRGETTRRHPARRRITVPGSLDGVNIALAHGSTPPEANLLLPSRTKGQSGIDQQKKTL